MTALDNQGLFAMAAAAVAALEFQRAADILIKLPASARRDAMLARCYRNTARPRDALELTEPHWQTDAAAASERGLTAMYAGGADPVECFERAEELGGTLDSIHGLAVIAEGQTRGGGDRERVYDLLRRGLERHPGEAMLLQTLGVARLNDGDAAGALERFEQVAALRSKPPWAGTRFEVEAHGNIACARVALGEHDAAIASVERAMQVCPRWLRQGMRTAMEADDDLAPLRDDPRFAAAIGRRPAAATPVKLPDVEAVYADTRSGQPARIDAACEAIRGLLDAREWTWEDHGDCEPTVRRRAEEVIERCLADTGWLADAIAGELGPGALGLVELMLGSHDPDLARTGAGLALATLERWLPEGRFELRDLLDVLEGFSDRDVWLRDSAPLLVAAANDAAIPTSLRRAALSALAVQGRREHAAAIAGLARDPRVAAAAVPAVRALDPAVIDPAALIASDDPEIRRAAALSYAAELAPAHTGALLEVWRDAGDRRELCDAVLPAVDERFVGAVIAECANPDTAYPCWRWLRGRRLSDDQLASLAGHAGAAPRGIRWLADVARAQGREVRVAEERIAGFPAVGDDPTEDTALAVGYLHIEGRADWLRRHLAGADRRTTAGTVVALGIVGSAEDLPALAQLGESIAWLKSDAWMARLLLGDDPALLDDVTPRSLFAAWALERLLGRWEPDRRGSLREAAGRANERGLHGEDLAEFRSTLERLR